MQNYIKKLVPTLIIAISSLSCGLDLSSSDHVQIVVKGDHFTIEWDDEALGIANNVYRPELYRVYYKVHGASSWEELGEVDAQPNPEYTVTEEMLDYGIYDLGVSAVSYSGEESEIHSSLEMTADPFCGWYVNWIGSK